MHCFITSHDETTESEDYRTRYSGKNEGGDCQYFDVPWLAHLTLSVMS